MPWYKSMQLQQRCNVIHIISFAYIYEDPDGNGTLNGNFTAKESTATELEEYSTLNQLQLHKSPM